MTDSAASTPPRLTSIDAFQGCLAEFHIANDARAATSARNEKLPRHQLDPISETTSAPSPRLRQLRHHHPLSSYSYSSSSSSRAG